LGYNVAEPPEQSCSPLYLLFHRAPVGYLVLDDIGLIRETNETFCRMADQEQDRLIGRSFSEWVTDIERGVFVARYRALFRSPAGQSLEAFVRRGHGSTFYAHLQGARIDTPPPCWRIERQIPTVVGRHRPDRAQTGRGKAEVGGHRLSKPAPNRSWSRTFAAPSKP
jgi:PAS domain S-box-containing protein